MVNKLLQLIAPHHCYGCGEIGTTLCSNCKYDIVSEPFSGCIVCARPAAVGICKTCLSSYERAWCVSDRTGTVERVINALKFERVKSAHESLASLLDDVVDVVSNEVIVVSVPTLSRHIRQRSYDHAALIARAFARKRKLRYETPLRRVGSSVQLGASKKDRMHQAKQAFQAKYSIQRGRTYLLVDDVVTTNATVRCAAQALKDAGADHVWVAVVARQPLDKAA